MNQQRKNMLATMVGLTLLIFSSCAGVVARDNVLLPAAKIAYESVRKDIDRGIADALQDGDIDQIGEAVLVGLADRLGAILTTGERKQLIEFSWGMLDRFARRGVQDRVDDGEISSGVAKILLQRIDNFRDALVELANRAYLTTGHRS